MIEARIDQKTLPFFAHLIPEMFQGSLQSGEIVGVGMYDMMEGDPIGVILMGQRNGWSEIQWLAIDEDYQSLDYPCQLIKNRVADCKWAGIHHGIFADLLTDDPMSQRLKSAFERVGFRGVEKSTNTYVATLEEALSVKARCSGEEIMVPLETATAQQLDALQTAINQDKRNVPADTTIQFGTYHPQLSGIHMQQGVPDGGLFFTTETDAIVLDLLWATNPKAVLPLFHNAVCQAEKRFPLTTPVYIHAVIPRAKELVSTLLPMAKPILKTQMQCHTR